MKVVDRFKTMVANITKSGAQIKEEITPEQAHMWHMATGISGEAGELLDAVKKHVIYQKELDRVNVIEELGDLEFYMEAFRGIIGVTRDEVLEVNLHKLVEGPNARYSNSEYSDKKAQDRADKQSAPEQIPEDHVTYVRDGDEMCAYRTIGFTNIPECEVGCGVTEVEALKDLLDQEAEVG
jgi:NTP pyrophosphatase (non-canonical NTP hydrolase)